MPRFRLAGGGTALQQAEIRGRLWWKTLSGREPGGRREPPRRTQGVRLTSTPAAKPRRGTLAYPGHGTAAAPHLAFLDVDDLYLPGRFDQAQRVFETEPACDGVYDAVGSILTDAKSARHAGFRPAWQASG